MREDYQEWLEKAFPDGYAIAYTCQDGQMRFSHYDPTNKNYFISQFYELAKEIHEEFDGEESWKIPQS